MSNKLYFIFSKDFPLDINTGSWSIEDDEPDKYYFIPESKINYGLKFHKLFFNDKNEFNKNLDPFNRDFMDVVVDKFVIPLDAEEHIEDYANFLGIDEIIFDNDHKYHKYFYLTYVLTAKYSPKNSYPKLKK